MILQILKTVNSMTLKTHKQPYDFMAKLIVIGDSGVGKTNIILSYAEQRFKQNYVATIGVDYKTKTIQVQDKKIKMQIWDTAGQERYRTITETYYKGASAIILVYSITDRFSFENINGWMSQINDKVTHNIPKILIGNKSDLSQTDRQVTFKEGQQLAQKYSSYNGKEKIEFCEISARTGDGIEGAFNSIAGKVKIELQKQYVVKPTVRIISSRNSKEERMLNCCT